MCQNVNVLLVKLKSNIQKIYLFEDIYGIETKNNNIIKLEIPGCGIKELPDSFDDLEFLEILDLSDNLLETLPESLSNLKSLKKLGLEGNPLVSERDLKTKLVLEQLEKNGVIIRIKEKKFINFF